MVWWQGILVILGSIVAGAIVGLLVSYVILRIQKRPWPLSRARRDVSVAEARVESASQARSARVKSRRSILELLSTRVIPHIQKISWSFSRGQRGITVAQARIESASQARIESASQARVESASQARVEPASQARDAEANPGSETQEATVVEQRIGTSARRYREDIESIREKREATVIEERVGSVTERYHENVESISEKREITVVEERVGPITELYHEDLESTKDKQEPVGSEEQVNSRTPNILREIEINLAVAVTPWTGRLLPFRTDTWDAGCSEVDNLPANCQYELAEAYADMHLANRIVWLSTDMGRKNEDLDDSYKQICAQISERLKKVNPSLKD